MKRKLILLGVAMFIFQINISAQDSKNIEKKRTTKIFHSSKKDISLKKDKIKNSEPISKKSNRNIEKEVSEAKSSPKIVKQVVIKRELTQDKKLSLLNEIELKIIAVTKKLEAETTSKSKQKYQLALIKLNNEKTLLLNNKL